MINEKLRPYYSQPKYEMVLSEGSPLGRRLRSSNRATIGKDNLSSGDSMRQGPLVAKVAWLRSIRDLAFSTFSLVPKEESPHGS